jgi:diguanylate cyclase (GGDEF)-like protein/PAS domain S-box-containing protein
LVLWVAIRHGIAGVPMANVLSASVAQFHDRLWLFQVCVGIVAATGLMLGIVVTERDASGRRLHGDLESAARKAAMLEASPDGIVAFDREGLVVEFNPAAERTFRHRRVDVLGREMAALLIPAAMRDDYRKRLARHLATGDAAWLDHRFETTAARADGTEFPVELTITRIALDGPPLFSAHLRDITEQKRVMSELSFQAAHDGLTELLNRASFLERLRGAAARASDSGGFMALLFVDVDRFKVINDRLGHLAGDHLLVAIARELKACVRPGDTVARLGGDEFAILLEDIGDVHDATAAADRIQASLRRPLQLDGHLVVATASIGITLSTPGRDQPEELLRTADAAMYDSKAIGPACYKVIDRRHAHSHPPCGAVSSPTINGV